MKILQNNLAKASTYLWGSMFGRGCSSGSDVVRLGGGFSSGELGWDDPGQLFKSCDMMWFNGDSGRGLLLMAAKSLWNLGRARHGFVLQHLSWGNTDSDPNRRHTAAGGWRSWWCGRRLRCIGRGTRAGRRRRQRGTGARRRRRYRTHWGARAPVSYTYCFSAGPLKKAQSGTKHKLCGLIT